MRSGVPLIGFEGISGLESMMRGISEKVKNLCKTVKITYGWCSCDESHCVWGPGGRILYYKLTNMETLTNRFIDKVVNGLRGTAIELEELQVQLALGKAEAADKYTEIKKKLNSFVDNIKSQLADSAQSSQLKAALQELQLQLALGKAETRDTFNAQKTKIVKALREVEQALLGCQVAEDLKFKLTNEFRIFRIKLDILRLRFNLNKMQARKLLRRQKNGFEDRLRAINDSLYDKESEVKDRWDRFSKEMGRAYTHLKRAFVS